MVRLLVDCALESKYNYTFQGWGYQSSGGVSPEKLLEVDVEIVSQDVCKSAMFGYEVH